MSTQSPAQVIDHIQGSVQLAIYALLYVVGVPLFIYRRRMDPIKERGWVLACLQMTFCLGEICFRKAGSLPPCIMNVMCVALTVPVWLYPYFIRSFVVWYRFRLQEMMLKQQTQSTTFKRLRWIQRNPWIISSTSQAAIFFLLVIFGIISGIGVYYTNVWDNSRCWVPAELHLVVGEAAVLALLLVLAIKYLWKVSDAYLIKHELTIVVATGIPVLILWAIAVTLNWRGGYSAGFWSTSLEIICIVVTIWMPLVASYQYAKITRERVNRLSSSVRDSSSIASSQGVEDEFRQVVNDEVLLAQFEKYVISAWAIENLMFHKRVEAYRLLEVGDREGEVKKIYHDFIAFGAIYELNLDESVSADLKKRIQAGESGATLFDGAEKLCLALLRFSVFPLWKSSKQFKDLLKKNKVKDLAEWKQNKGDQKTRPRSHFDEHIIAMDLEHHPEH